MKIFNYIIFMLIVLTACTDKPEINQEPVAITDKNTFTLTDEQIRNGDIVVGKAETKNLSRSIRVAG